VFLQQKKAFLVFFLLKLFIIFFYLYFFDFYFVLSLYSLVQEYILPFFHEKRLYAKKQLLR